MSSLTDSIEEPPIASNKKILTFSPNDTENPYNWPPSKKILIILLGTLVVLNTTLASSLPSLAQTALLKHFGVKEEIQEVLPNSIYLVGYVLGPTLWAPLSENFGRRWITVGAFGGYMGCMAGCAVAPTWGGFVGLRLLSGEFGRKL
jgi:MFS family permease